MTDQIEVGAVVECSDYSLGAVERVESGGDDGGALLVRPARSDYLLKIPRSLVAEASTGRVRLNARLEDVEQYALQEQPREPAGGKVTTRAASPGPRDDDVLPRPPGEPPTSPQTG
jgi:hypothetical protein